MLSHELRNPLSTIINATQLLSRSESPERDAETLAVAQRQSDQMAALLDDLLDVTRVSHGKIRLQKRPFDLQRAIDAALESVQARCDARQQSVDALRPDEPIWVNGSEPRVLQVLSNLLTNASKYSSQGSEIGLEVVLEGGDARIMVRDQGVGIAEDQLGKVFDLFVQSDRTLDRADGGLGIGLTLVKSLVELHDGRVAAHSEGAGCGSEFTVWLPTCNPPRITAEPDDSDASDNGQPPGRVVLVEDNVDASRMMAFLLEDAGFQVSIANDGAKGLEAIRSQQPDIAVVDIGLPELNGYDLARAVRESDGDSIYLIAFDGLRSGRGPRRRNCGRF